MKNLILVLFATLLFNSCCNEANTTKTKSIQQRQTMLVHPTWSNHSNIYEVNIRQYTPEGTFKAFEQHLDRLHQMGVDILWLMPVSPIGVKNRKGSLGSYYSVKDYTAINPEFGTMDDFKELVKHAHTLGMHLIIDWVANHTAWDNHWITEHPEWYKKDSLGNISSPFDWTDVAALNYENHELWKSMIDKMKFWITTANIDGFRCDVAGMVPTPFWDSARMVLDHVKPVFMLAEAEKPEQHLHAFDMSYGWAMHHKMAMVAQGKEPASALGKQIQEDLTRFGTNAYRMQFTTNHDENSWNGTEYEKMKEGVKTMAVLTFVIPGMPLIYSGQEAANNKRLKFFEKDSINWSSLPLKLFYQNLIQLKNKNSALWNGDFGGLYKTLSTSNNQQVFAFTRANQSNSVIFIGNMSVKPIKVKINFGKDAGTYQDWYSKKQIKLENTKEFLLKPWENRVYIK